MGWALPLAGLASAAIPTIASFFGKGKQSKDKIKQLPTMTPQQQGAQSGILQQLQQMLGQGGGYQNAMGVLQGYLDPNSEQYQNFEQPYLNQFNQQTVPGLAERFAGFGGGMGGGLSSSGFGQALSAAGGNLQNNLAQMKSGMQRNAANDILGQFSQLANQGLNKDQFAYTNQQGTMGGGASGFNQLAQNLNPGVLMQLFQSLGIGGNSAGQNTGGYQPQFDMTPSYDKEFRQQGVNY